MYNLAKKMLFFITYCLTALLCAKPKKRNKENCLLYKTTEFFKNPFLATKYMFVRQERHKVNH